MQGSSAPAPIAPGQIIADKYRVERVLGQGGMGVVVAARHLDLEERVAIKFLVNARDGAAITRFLREARTAAKVKSEHVCRVHDVGRLPTGAPFLVMEYLEGADLAHEIAKHGAQPVQLVAGWIIEVCDALADAHALGIVHRDLKPANVFLAKRSDGTTCAKVLDFGVSKLPASTSLLTHATAVMGSPAYMSPEQIESASDVDARADVWSLGIVMYELLTGKLPFEAESLVQLAVKIRERQPTPIAELRKDVPEGMTALIEKCLAKSRASRPASVADVAVALAPFASQDAQAIATRLSRRAARSSHPRIEPPPESREGEEGYEPTEPQRPITASNPEARSSADAVAKTLESSPRITADTAADTTAPKAAVVTFSPVSQPASSTSPSSKIRRRLVAAAGAAVGVAITVAVLVARTSARHAAMAPAAPTAPTAPVSASPPVPSAPAAPEHPAEPPASSAPAEPAPAEPDVARPGTSRPVPSATAKKPRTPATGATATASASSEAAKPAASSSATAPKKKRDLDRDDPFSN